MQSASKMYPDITLTSDSQFLKVLLLNYLTSECVAQKKFGRFNKRKSSAIRFRDLTRRVHLQFTQTSYLAVNVLLGTKSFLSMVLHSFIHIWSIKILKKIGNDLRSVEMRCIPEINLIKSELQYEY